MKYLLSSVSMVAVLGGVAAPALADGYFEGVLGVAEPIGDDDYDDYVDGSLKLGIRAGGGAGPTAVELTADVTPYDDDLDSAIADASIQRYRALVGIRHRIPTGKRGGEVVIRAGVGADILKVGVSGSLLGIEYERNETDLGLAVELGAGLLIPLGKAYLGPQVALPMGFHFDDDDPNDPEDNNLEYTAIDIDLLLVAGTRF